MWAIFNLHLGLSWLQNFQYVTSGKCRTETTFPIKVLEYPNMDAIMGWSLKYIKMQELNRFDLFYSIAAMSYPCLIKFECISPNLLFMFFDWNPWMVICALVSQSFKKFEWSMTGQPVSNSQPYSREKREPPPSEGRLQRTLCSSVLPWVIPD